MFFYTIKMFFLVFVYLPLLYCCFFLYGSGFGLVSLPRRGPRQRHLLLLEQAHVMNFLEETGVGGRYILRPH